MTLHSHTASNQKARTELNIAQDPRGVNIITCVKCSLHYTSGIHNVLQLYSKRLEVAWLKSRVSLHSHVTTVS